MRLSASTIGLLLATALSVPAEPGALEVVARIGDHEITVEQLQQFRDESTASYRDPLEGADAWHFYLQTMIDMELMLLEAADQRLDKTSSFVEQWDVDRRRKFIDEYTARNIIEDLDLSLEDMRQRFIDSKWNRVLKLAHIRSDSEKAAENVVRHLAQGRDFADLAREFSTVSTTAARGGRLEHWFGRGNLEEFGLSLEVGEALFDLSIGDVSSPLQIGDHYEVFQVLEEGPAPESYRAAFMRADYWHEFQARWMGMVDRLRLRMDAQVDGTAVRFLVDRMAGSDGQGILLDPEEQQMILCHGDGFELTVLDFTKTYNALWFIRSVSFDSTSIADFVERDVMPRAIVYQAALNEGLDKDPDLVDWLREKRNSLLLDALGKKEVVDQVQVDSSEVRRFYHTNAGLFMEPEEIQLTEILLATRSEAEALRVKIRDGGDMDTLAAQHSIRVDESGHGHLHMHNHPSQRSVYGRLYDEVIAAPLNELVGPFGLDEGFSIFKVSHRVAPQHATFESAASRAEWWIRKQEEKRLFEQLFTRLRDKYSSTVVIYEDSLGRLVAN